nr:Uncharacterised protein [Providencia rettgeri]
MSMLLAFYLYKLIFLFTLKVIFRGAMTLSAVYISSWLSSLDGSFYLILNCLHNLGKTIQ